MMDWLDRKFELTLRGTDLHTEFRAGLSTFLTMAYILVVNPVLLSKAGIPFEAVVLATVLVASLSSIAMGLATNLPVALAPGMGMNAFFTFTLVLGSGVPWQTGLGVVLLSGLFFVALSLSGIRQAILAAIPETLKLGVAVGIGLFLSLIGLNNAGFITAHPATLVGFGGLNAQTLLFLFGLFSTAALLVLRIRGALILGILATTWAGALAQALGWGHGLSQWPVQLWSWPSGAAVLALDLPGALVWSMVLPIFTFLFTDLFDSLATLMAVGEIGGFLDQKGQPRQIKRALLVDALSTVLSGLVGTSPGTAYIESAAGIREGGRSGLTAVFAGLFFLPFLFLSPLVGLIPSYATSPALVLVGLFMLTPARKIPFDNLAESFPAFLAILLIPLTYSITQGIVWGFLSYSFLKLVRGRAHEVPWVLWAIDVLAVVALVYG